MQYCNGSDPTVISTTSCSVPKTTLNRSPTSLSWGVSVYAYVVARNIIGPSASSAIGNGALLLTYPDAPINLANNPAITSGSQIGLTWSQGASNGGVPILSYDIIYDNAAGNE